MSRASDGLTRIGGGSRSQSHGWCSPIIAAVTGMHAIRRFYGATRKLLGNILGKRLGFRKRLGLLDIFRFWDRVGYGKRLRFLDIFRFWDRVGFGKWLRFLDIFRIGKRFRFRGCLWHLDFVLIREFANGGFYDRGGFLVIYDSTGCGYDEFVEGFGAGCSDNAIETFVQFGFGRVCIQRFRGSRSCGRFG